jgi:hypothetical protein
MLAMLYFAHLSNSGILSATRSHSGWRSQSVEQDELAIERLLIECPSWWTPTTKDDYRIIVKTLERAFQYNPRVVRAGAKRYLKYCKPGDVDAVSKLIVLNRLYFDVPSEISPRSAGTQVSLIGTSSQDAARTSDTTRGLYCFRSALWPLSWHGNKLELVGSPFQSAPTSYRFEEEFDALLKKFGRRKTTSKST